MTTNPVVFYPKASVNFTGAELSLLRRSALISPEAAHLMEAYEGREEGILRTLLARIGTEPDTPDEEFIAEKTITAELDFATVDAFATALDGYDKIADEPKAAELAQSLRVLQGKITEAYGSANAV